MEGRARAAKRSHELALSQAWHTERFAREDKLKPLSTYLRHEKRRTTSADLIAGFEAMKAAGTAITIRRIDRRTERTVTNG